MARRRSLVGAAALGAAVVTGAGAAAARRWAATEDPTEGQPLCLPDGEDVVVATDDGARLQVRVAGDGPTVVLSHCWTGDRRVWGPVARRLVASGHRVVLYDHRGHGGSTVGADGLTLDALAADLRAVLEQLDVRDAVIAGHSMGGMATQAFAIAYPEVVRERVAGLVLVATACDRLGVPVVGPVVRRAIGSRSLERVLAGRRSGPMLVRFVVGRRAALSHLVAVTETFNATAGSARRDSLDAMVSMDLAPGLPSIEVPVLLVTGSRDLLVPAPRSRRIAQLVPAARHEVVRGAGHLLPREVPDRLASLIAHEVRTTTTRSSA